MEKEIIEEIREGKQKEKENKWAKQLIELGSIANGTTWKTIEKCIRAQFITIWSPLVVVKMGHHFHHNFQVGVRTDPHMYMGVNLGYIAWVQQHAKVIDKG